MGCYSGTVKLTQRELDVMRLVAEGLTDRQTAEALFVSIRTVNFHCANVYDKLRVHNRMQAVNALRRQGLIKGED